MGATSRASFRTRLGTWMLLAGGFDIVVDHPQHLPTPAITAIRAQIYQLSTTVRRQAARATGIAAVVILLVNFLTTGTLQHLLADSITGILLIGYYTTIATGMRLDDDSPRLSRERQRQTAWNIVCGAGFGILGVIGLATHNPGVVCWIFVISTTLVGGALSCLIIPSRPGYLYAAERAVMEVALDDIFASFPASLVRDSTALLSVARDWSQKRGVDSDAFFCLLDTSEQTLDEIAEAAQLLDV